MAVSRRLSDALHRCHTRLDLLSVHSARCRGSLFFHSRRQMPWLAQRSCVQRDTDPGGSTPWVNRSCSRTARACALLCGEWAQRFQICIFGEGWLKRVPPPAPFIPPLDIQNSCSVFKWTVWCWQMKVDLCSYTKGHFVVWISRLSEEALQKDNCPSLFEPCKITLLERVDVRIYTLLFFPVPF